MSAPTICLLACSNRAGSGIRFPWMRCDYNVRVITICCSSGVCICNVAQMCLLYPIVGLLRRKILRFCLAPSNEQWPSGVREKNTVLFVFGDRVTERNIILFTFSSCSYLGFENKKIGSLE